MNLPAPQNHKVSQSIRGWDWGSAPVTFQAGKGDGCFKVMFLLIIIDTTFKQSVANVALECVNFTKKENKCSVCVRMLGVRVSCFAHA